MKAFGRLHVVLFLPFIIIIFMVWVLTGAFAFSTIYVPLSLVMAIFWQVVQSTLYCILEFARRRTSTHKLNKLRKMQDLVDRTAYWDGIVPENKKLWEEVFSRQEKTEIDEQDQKVTLLMIRHLCAHALPYLMSQHARAAPPPFAHQALDDNEDEKRERRAKVLLRRVTRKTFLTRVSLFVYGQIDSMLWWLDGRPQNLQKLFTFLSGIATCFSCMNEARRGTDLENLQLHVDAKDKALKLMTQLKMKEKGDRSSANRAQIEKEIKKVFATATRDKGERPIDLVYNEAWDEHVIAYKLEEREESVREARRRLEEWTRDPAIVKSNPDRKLAMPAAEIIEKIKRKLDEDKTSKESQDRIAVWAFSQLVDSMDIQPRAEENDVMRIIRLKKRAAVMAFDGDGGGSIDKDELDNALEDLGVNKNDPGVLKIKQKYFRDGRPDDNTPDTKNELSLLEMETLVEDLINSNSAADFDKSKAGKILSKTEWATIKSANRKNQRLKNKAISRIERIQRKANNARTPEEKAELTVHQQVEKQVFIKKLVDMAFEVHSDNKQSDETTMWTLVLTTLEGWMDPNSLSESAQADQDGQLKEESDRKEAERLKNDKDFDKNFTWAFQIALARRDVRAHLSSRAEIQTNDSSSALLNSFLLFSGRELLPASSKQLPRASLHVHSKSARGPELRGRADHRRNQAGDGVTAGAVPNRCLQLADGGDRICRQDCRRDDEVCTPRTRLARPASCTSVTPRGTDGKRPQARGFFEEGCRQDLHD